MITELVSNCVTEKTKHMQTWNKKQSWLFIAAC